MNLNSKTRLDRYLAGQPVDRRPNLTIIGSVVTRYTGIDIETYCKDPRAMAQSAIECARDCRLDFVQIASDLVRAAEGFGSRINYFPDKLPSVAVPALDDITDVDRLKPLKTTDVRRLYDLVEGTAYAMEHCEEIHTMTLITGPATVAGNTRGIQDFLVDAFDEEDAAAQLMDLATETALDLIRELKAAGASYLYVADPVASLFSPDAYRELVLPRHKRIYEAMDKAGICGRLHMCGDTRKILPYSSTCGAKILDIDHAVPYAEALKTVEGRVLLNGNIDPVADVFSCDAAHTKAAMLARADEIGRARGLFMPGCELPTRTPLENVKAIAEALDEIGG